LAIEQFVAARLDAERDTCGRADQGDPNRYFRPFGNGHPGLARDTPFLFRSHENPRLGKTGRSWWANRTRCRFELGSARQNRHRIDTAAPRRRAHLANLLSGLVELTGDRTRDLECHVLGLRAAPRGSSRVLPADGLRRPVKRPARWNPGGTHGRPPA